MQRGVRRERVQGLPEEEGTRGERVNARGGSEQANQRANVWK